MFDFSIQLTANQRAEFFVDVSLDIFGILQEVGEVLEKVPDVSEDVLVIHEEAQGSTENALQAFREIPQEIICLLDQVQIVIEEDPQILEELGP